MAAACCSAPTGTRSAIWWRPADMSAEATPLLSGTARRVRRRALPGCAILVYQIDTLGADLYYRAMTGDSTPKPIAEPDRHRDDAAGLARRPLDRLHDQRIGTRRDRGPALPGPGGRVQVSASGGTEPVGRATEDDCSIAPAESSWRRSCARPSFTVARDTVIADPYVFATNPHASYDVFPDGKHFVFLEPGSRGRDDGGGELGAVLRARMARGRSRCLPDSRGVEPPGSRTAADAPRRLHPSADSDTTAPGARGQQSGPAALPVAIGP